MEKRQVGVICDILKDMDVFFHRRLLAEYIMTETFERLQAWLDAGMCFDLSILAMLSLKKVPSSTLCYGTVTRKNGDNGGYHCWVEFTFGNDRYIADFTWAKEGFTVVANSSEETAFDTMYIRSEDGYILADGGGTLSKDFSIDHDGFWKYAFSNQLYEAMLDPRTSNVLGPLGKFLNPEIKPGILLSEDYCERRPGFVSLPYFVRNKPISDGIIRYFLDNKDATEPSEQVLKAAERAVEATRRYMLSRGIVSI